MSNNETVGVFKEIPPNLAIPYGRYLIGRFRGDRFKTIVTISNEVGPVDVAMVHVLDLHNSTRLYINEFNGVTRLALKPIYSSIIGSRTSDGSPHISAVREIVDAFLSGYLDDWRECQTTEGYYCVDLAVMNPEDMKTYLYPILL